MLTSAAPEPHIQRFLVAAAAALCGHSVVASPCTADRGGSGCGGGGKRLLPSLDRKWAEPRLGLPVPLVLGGQLAEAAGGVLLLSSAVSLDAKRAIGLGQYLAAGQAVLDPGTGGSSDSAAAAAAEEHCCTVPTGATLWTMVHEQGEGVIAICLLAMG